ncbi:MAG: hypothetical protein EZS28_020365 [Streblomastix strix]|uniref:Uncharacterized protein n=1 Tax=Streblomastix strix TaxID=222440 RepID=A0A5J4VP79_9EUKA|nr:MAG: hypothetical protein EZS28_020365 [Streblomastix strix]
MKSVFYQSVTLIMNFFLKLSLITRGGAALETGLAADLVGLAICDVVEGAAERVQPGGGDLIFDYYCGGESASFVCDEL